MSSTMKFPSQAPLLISCTLPLASVAQPPAGSFRERAATPFSFQQLCPPDFPMPDIRKRQCAEPIDLHTFAPVRHPSCIGWNRPLIYGSVPAEIVSGRLQLRPQPKPPTRPTPGSRTSRIGTPTANGLLPISADGDDGLPHPYLPRNQPGRGVPDDGQKSSTAYIFFCITEWKTLNW